MTTQPGTIRALPQTARTDAVGGASGQASARGALLLERGTGPSRRTLDTRGDGDYENQPVDAVGGYGRRLASQAVRQWGFMQGLKQKLGPVSACG